MDLDEALNETLTWPFFDDGHRRFAGALSRWADATLRLLPHDDIDAACRARVSALGEAGYLKAVVPAEHGGLHARLDVRTLCLAREILAARDGLADFAFAMQGLGTGSISLFGSTALKARYLPPVREGKAIAAFALSEPEAGSDVAALATTATPDGPSHFRIDGTKTWISNGGIADHYVVFVRTGESSGAKGLSAFVVDADAPGLTVAERIEVIAPHPLATLRFDGVRVPAANRLGLPGDGFKVAMATLDIFRSTVGAAALGFARRALHETIERATTRKLFGAPLGELQLTQAAIAESASDVDASALLIYRAAWTKDQGAARVTREAAMAKMFATEAAQSVIDRAVQLHGGLGVTKGVEVEKLYREIRALRIYEGATEVQKIVIARELLKRRATQSSPAAVGAWHASPAKKGDACVAPTTIEESPGWHREVRQP
jgi:acyl-CoA dehydrogenase